jgi:hypothetical protein
MKPKVYVLHTDPGHGWLAVKRRELAELGIAKEITQYSYQKGNTVYLEEDLDMQNFLIACRVYRGAEPEFRTSNRNESHPIRRFARYTTSTVDH